MNAPILDPNSSSNEDTSIDNTNVDVITQRLKILLCTYVLVCAIIVFGVFNGILSFGTGLGDLGMLISLLFTCVLFVVLVKFQGMLPGSPLFRFSLLAFLMFAASMYFGLSLTIWRGAEQPWDGSLFV